MPCAAKKRDHGVVGIAEVDPLKSRPFEVDLIEGRLRSIQPIQILDETLKPSVRSELQEMPLEAVVVVPFPPLPELRAHEQHVLAGMRVEVSEERSHIRKTLPEVPRHFVQE